MARIHWSVWLFASVGLLLLLVDHWAHVMGVVPYLVLLACPLMHLLHGRHGGHRHGTAGRRE